MLGTGLGTVRSPILDRESRRFEHVFRRPRAEITHADKRRVRLRCEAALPYQGIPGQPAQPARQTKTGIQAPRPPQPPKPPPKAVPPTPAEPPEPPQPRADGGQRRPVKQPKQVKREICAK